MKFAGTIIVSIVSFLLTINLSVLAETHKTPDSLYIIFDASNSMWGELPDKSRKITIAKDVFNNLNPMLFAERDVALRLYGHRRTGDCSDTELAVPFASAKTSLSKISNYINAIKPRGKTPITRSLIAALKDFGDKTGDILLISDGIETCDADPCDLVRSWRENDINIRVHVVGLGLSDQARSAMQCIADASGTDYKDVNSARELTNAIEVTAGSKPPEPGIAKPKPQEAGSEFKLSAVDENGHYVPVLGTLNRVGEAVREISSNGRYVFKGGEYSITVGVPTVNNKLYKPITQSIQIKAIGSTKIVINLQRPPTIRTKFMENGEQVSGVIAYVYQDGKEVFRLRTYEDYFVMPGVYRFTAALNKDNQLEIIETLAPGDDKDIVFQAVETVRTTFKVFAAGQDKKLRQHQQLWQDGELKYKIHVHNGAEIKPGIYTLRSIHALTPYAIEDVKVPAMDKQTIELTVPFGAARITYIFKTPPDRKGRRCWIYPVDKQGKHAAIRSRAQSCNGSEIAMAEGRYYIQIWKALGEFEETYFDVVKGEASIVSIEQK